MISDFQVFWSASNNARRKLDKTVGIHSWTRSIMEKVEHNSEIAIRRATLDDSLEISEIYNQGIEDRSATFETELRTKDSMREWLVEHKTKNHPVIVGVLQDVSDNVVGWASVSTYRPRYCYSGIGEFSIYVRKGYRRHGIGEKLLLSLVDEARKAGFWKLVSRIFTFNMASRELCKKCGFREVGIYEKHGKLDGKWLDTVIVERLIPENLL